LALAVHRAAEDITDSEPGRTDLRVPVADKQESPTINPM
jgi:hypothetical protein